MFRTAKKTETGFGIEFRNVAGQFSADPKTAGRRMYIEFMREAEATGKLKSAEELRRAVVDLTGTAPLPMTIEKKHHSAILYSKRIVDISKMRQGELLFAAGGAKLAGHPEIAAFPVYEAIKEAASSGVSLEDVRRRAGELGLEVEFDKAKIAFDFERGKPGST